MRETNREYGTNKTTIVAKQAEKETIISIVENKHDQLVLVEVGLFSENEMVAREYYTIVSDDYDLLMSESPQFAPSKPQNEYREIDLWYMVDLIRNRE